MNAVREPSGDRPSWRGPPRAARAAAASSQWLPAVSQVHQRLAAANAIDVPSAERSNCRNGRCAASYVAPAAADSAAAIFA